MEILAFLGTILTFLGALPSLIEKIQGLWNSAVAYFRKRQIEKISKELGEAIERATGKQKDTRDIEKIFNPDRTYPVKSPADSK